MLILPFIHKIINKNDFQINIIKILTIGGKKIWEENDNLDIDIDILNPNDIYRTNKKIQIDANCILFEIDTHKTKIDDFYKWEEIDINDTETFCWKSFYYLLGNNNNWLNIPENEVFDKYKVKYLINKIIQNNKITK
jgi:hypothetical protein